MVSAVPKELPEIKSGDFGKSLPVATSTQSFSLLDFSLCIGLTTKSKAVGKMCFKLHPTSKGVAHTMKFNQLHKQAYKQVGDSPVHTHRSTVK